MIVPDQPFQPGDCEGFGRVGNEAVVQQVAKDRFGYPQVYVAWNTDHWSFNGTEDGWHWSNHFEPTEQKALRYEPIRGTIVIGSSDNADFVPEGTHDGNEIAAFVIKFTEEIMELARRELSND